MAKAEKPIPKKSGSGSQKNSSNSQFDERLKGAFLRLCEPLGGSSKAEQRLTALQHQWPSRPVKVRYTYSHREEILPAGVLNLSVGIDATTGADCLSIHDTRYFHPAECEYDGPAEFFVRSTDTDRELARAADVKNARNVRTRR